MASAGSPSQLPLSRPFHVSGIGSEGVRTAIEASEAESRALAANAKVVAIEGLRAEFDIRPEGLTGVHVTGEVSARVRQTCVRSLDDFDSDVVEPVDVHFLPAEDLAVETARRARLLAGGDPEAGEADFPDPIVNDRIDLGVLAAEFLVLGLDPYPKKPGAALSGPETTDVADREASPFAVLGRLRS